MARRVFFSFHYERDIWRANVVRNSWVTQDTAGFFDASLWEEAKKKGDEAIKRLIDKGLENTSVTAVLIGAETFDRQYVLYEIIQSHNRGNGLLGISINNIADKNGLTDYAGRNPFDKVYVERSGARVYLTQIYPTYDWILNDGYNHFSDWIENAYKQANQR